MIVLKTDINKTVRGVCGFEKLFPEAVQLRNLTRECIIV